MTETELQNLLNQIEDARSDAYETANSYAEISAEYKGEVSRFGDAWVGAGEQLSRLSKRFDTAMQKVKDLEAKLPPVHGCKRPPLGFVFGEIPF